MNERRTRIESKTVWFLDGDLISEILAATGVQDVPILPSCVPSAGLIGLDDLEPDP